MCDFLPHRGLHVSPASYSLQSCRRRIFNAILNVVVTKYHSCLQFSRSQSLQDLFVLWIYEDYPHITYFEAGAHDGITLSNTFLFEVIGIGSGILIEPNPSLSQRLIHNRPGSHVEITCLAREADLSFSTSCLAGRSLYNVCISTTSAGQHSGEGIVISRTIADLCVSYGVTCIDFLSLDIEGSEFDALSGLGEIPFNVAIIECNNGMRGAKKILSLLKSLGYSLYRYPFSNYELLALNSRFIFPPHVLEFLAPFSL
jgi:FkbM family methyltransferase